jgi:hypothetical protein
MVTDAVALEALMYLLVPDLIVLMNIDGDLTLGVALLYVMLKKRCNLNIVVIHR